MSEDWQARAGVKLLPNGGSISETGTRYTLVETNFMRCRIEKEDLKVRAEEAEAEVIEKVKRGIELEEELQKYKQEFNKVIGALHEAQLEIDRLKTPVDDRRLAEIRAAMKASKGPRYYVPKEDAEHLLAEIDRLKGTLASYADGKPLVKREAK